MTDPNAFSASSACCSFIEQGDKSPIHCNQIFDEPLAAVRSISPHPDPSSIAKSSDEVKTVLKAFHRICKDSNPPVSFKVLNSLRKPGFNHWKWDEAHLIWFVRHMLLEFSPPAVRSFTPSLSRLSESSDFHYSSTFEGACPSQQMSELRKKYISGLESWLELVWLHYNRVPFHNFEHAFAVTQMMYAVLHSLHTNFGTAPLEESSSQQQFHRGQLPSLIQWVLLVASLSHDLDHPGFNNAYQVNANTFLQERYGSESTLERHHSNFAHKLLLLCPCEGFIYPLSPEEHKIAFAILESTILSTDMSKHSDIVARFRELFLQTSDSLHSSSTLPSPSSSNIYGVEHSSATHMELLCQCLLKACDISNEVRPPVVSEVWLDRLLTEFFTQSDHEKRVGLPVAPFMDREKVTKWDSQVGFCKFVILPLFEALGDYLWPLQDILVVPVKRQLLHYTQMGELQRLANSTETEESSSNTVTVASRKSSAGSMIDASASPKISAQ